MQEKPDPGKGGPITIAFRPKDFKSKTHFIRVKKIEWGKTKTPQQIKEFIESSEKMCGTKFPTITGNNRRVIRELVRNEKNDVSIMSKANDNFFKTTSCKLAIGLPLEIQRWYAEFDNNANKLIVRDTPYDRCTVCPTQNSPKITIELKKVLTSFFRFLETPRGILEAHVSIRVGVG